MRPRLSAPLARPDGTDLAGDAERKSRHPHRVEPSVLRRYKETYANHFTLWKNACQRHLSALARIPSETDLQTSLFADAVPSGALEIIH